MLKVNEDFSLADFDKESDNDLYIQKKQVKIVQHGYIEEFLIKRFQEFDDSPLDNIDRDCIKTLNENPQKFVGIIKPLTIKNLKSMILRGIEYLGNDGNFNWLDVSKMKSLTALFNGNETFNGDITLWDVSNVEQLNWTFQKCKSFKRDLSSWNNSNFKYLISAFKDSEYPYIDLVKTWAKGKNVVAATTII